MTSPSGGTVTIARTTTGADPTGLDVLGVRFLIDAPAATVESPLVLDFRLDASFLPPGIALDDVQILRDGAIAGPCTGSTPYSAATPDPCVASRTLVTGGNILIRTLSSHASEWAFASEVCPSPPDPTCATPTKAGKSKIVLRAKGTALAIPALPLAAPVTLQLRTAADRCFGATFSTPAPAKDPALQFKAESD